MYDFAHAKDQWYPTWPTDEKARALSVYVLIRLPRFLNIEN